MNNSQTIELSDEEFIKISRLIHELCGINLQAGKEELVKARLMKRLREMNMENFEQYLRYIEEDQTRAELGFMVDALTTNKTSFFRETEQFDFLRRAVLPDIRNRCQRMRFWSAGCSSGEEAYSLAMLLREELPDADARDIRILATDISARVLDRARDAKYREDVLEAVPARLLRNYFTCVERKPPRIYRLNECIREMVSLARLNLMDKWPMKGPFNVILCRNVMIYFDKKTREQLVNSFWELLEPGGHFFVGHSESLTNISHRFGYVQPAVYQKQTN